MSNFYPEKTLSFQSFNDFKSQYEGVKEAYQADLSTVENCLGKCGVTFNGEATFPEKEVTCLRKCYGKYFDSALLIEKEMKHFVHGQNI